MSSGNQITRSAIKVPKKARAVRGTEPAFSLATMFKNQRKLPDSDFRYLGLIHIQIFSKEMLASIILEGGKNDATSFR
jgi:hypothetical protein